MNARQTLTNLLHTTARHIPCALLTRWVKREVTAVFYHAVSDSPLEHVRHLYPVVPVAAFQEALRYMRGHFNFVSYHQLQDHFLGKQSLPANALHLSFDDGFAECYHVVRPILLEQGIPCTFFLTIDWLDNRMLYYRHAISLFVARLMAQDPAGQGEFLAQLNQRLELSLQEPSAFVDWITGFRKPHTEVMDQVGDILKVEPKSYLAKHRPYLSTVQVQEMAAEGFTIGAHGLSHRKLGFIPSEDVEDEIAKSCRGVQAITGQRLVPFSFPQSAGNLDRDHLAEIRSRHPQVGLLFDTKDLRIDSPFILNRVWAERPLTPERNLHPFPEIMEHAIRQAWVEGILDGLRGIRRANETDIQYLK